MGRFIRSRNHAITRRSRITIALVGAFAAAFVAAAGAQATATTGSAAGMTFDLGPSPVGLPSTCQFANGDANFLFLGGSTVFHESSNKNGDWGGQTAQGPATFFEDSTAIATGHLTIWGGGGNNSQGQSAGGLTLNFTSSTVSIHVNFHQTVNAKGVPTANPANVKVVCG
jgi:hypothetical protein